jgi:hypothetical protein
MMKNILFHLLLVILLTFFFSTPEIWTEEEEKHGNFPFYDYFTNLSGSELNYTEVDKFAKESGN